MGISRRKSKNIRSAFYTILLWNKICIFIYSVYKIDSFQTCDRSFLVEINKYIINVFFF